MLLLLFISFHFMENLLKSRQADKVEIVSCGICV